MPLLLAGFVRDVVSSIELGKSHGPYRLHQEVAAAPPTQTIPHPSYAAPLTAADFGDSVPGVSGVSGAGVSGVPGVSGVSGVPHPHWHPPWHIETWTMSG